MGHDTVACDTSSLQKIFFILFMLLLNQTTIYKVSLELMSRFDWCRACVMNTQLHEESSIPDGINDFVSFLKNTLSQFLLIYDRRFEY